MDFQLTEPLMLTNRDFIEDTLYRIPEVNFEPPVGKSQNISSKILKYFFSKAKFYYKRNSGLRKVVNFSYFRLLTQKVIQLGYKYIESSSGKIGPNKFFSLDQGLGIQTSENPLVTVIIPVHNKWDVTLKCLMAIKKNTPYTPFEIILVDDASTDETQVMTRNIRGVRVLRINSNLGFLQAVNLASTFVRGKYILILNNDTEPLQGWLDSMFNTMNCDDSIAIVGAKLIYPSGVLQEAGGMVFSNGNAWNLGRGQNPNNPEFNFHREVDYVSGAAMLVRRSFWEHVNGFDEYYSPAYCEDTDICLKAWDLNFRVIYDPNSIVIHHEGLSHGTSILTGLKKYQEVNLKKLKNRWNESLAKHWNEEKPRFEFARDSKGIIIFLDTQLPSFYRDSGSLRTIEICKKLHALRYHVILAGLDSSTSYYDIHQLTSLGIEVHKNLEELNISLESRRDRVLAIWSCKKPSYIAAKGLFNSLEPKVKFIADLLDLEQENFKIDMRQLEIAKEADLTLLVSPSESNLLRNTLVNTQVIDIWQSFRTVERLFNFEDTKGLLFIGGFRHLPNLVGLKWFGEQVLPILRAQGYNYKVTVIGGGLEICELKLFESMGMEMVGQIDEIDCYFQKARVFINPLITGAGLKGKVAQSMCYGLPVVTTVLGADGFNIENNKEALLGDSPAEFAKAIVELYENQSSRHRISSNSSAYINEKHSESIFKSKLESILEYIRI